MENITERGQNPSRKTKKRGPVPRHNRAEARRVGDLYTADTSVSQSPKSATVCLRSRHSGTEPDSWCNSTVTCPV